MVFAARGHPDIHFDRRPVRRMAMAAGISDGMPRLKCVLFCDPMGMIPRVALCTGQSSGNSGNGPITAAYYKHSDPSRQGILDHCRQVAARFNQEMLQGRVSRIASHGSHPRYQPVSGRAAPCTGIEDQLGSHPSYMGWTSGFFLGISGIRHLSFFRLVSISDKRV